MSLIRSVMSHPNYDRIFKKCPHPRMALYTTENSVVICMKCGATSEEEDVEKKESNETD